MNGSLNQHIIREFKDQFENNCIRLLLESHKELVQHGSGFRDSDENSITVQLIGYMKKNPVSSDYKIDITREQYIDSDAVYAGIDDPDASPRIDIRLMNWTSPEKFEYFFEAKNLYENNFTKFGRATVTNAKAYCQRYIDTGIQNFIGGKYPRGCLVGYVLEGKSDSIAARINELLTEAKRNTEHLVNQPKFEKIQFRYLSTHTGCSLSELTHYFLSFT